MTDTLDMWGFDHQQDGLYRHHKTGKVVRMKGILHRRDGTGRIDACFTGTRNGLGFGRAFSKPMEDFFQNYIPVMLDVGH